MTAVHHQVEEVMRRMAKPEKKEATTTQLQLRKERSTLGEGAGKEHESKEGEGEKQLRSAP